MQYMLIHAVDTANDLSERQAAEAQSSLTAWLEEVLPLGVDLQGSRLRPTSDATTVRERYGELLVTDGPFAETKEQVAGYDVIECASAEEALQWAAKHPTARMGAIEVRPLSDSPAAVPLPEQQPATMRYILLVCVDEHVQLTSQEAAGMGPATEAWVAEMERKGARLYGAQSGPAGSARTVRVRDDDVLVTDGPFAETKEQIAGFDILECADLDEAIDAAAKHPVSRIGAMEVRPFWPLEQAPAGG